MQRNNGHQVARPTTLQDTERRPVGAFRRGEQDAERTGRVAGQLGREHRGVLAESPAVRDHLAVDQHFDFAACVPEMDRDGVAALVEVETVATCP